MRQSLLWFAVIGLVSVAIVGCGQAPPPGTPKGTSAKTSTSAKAETGQSKPAAVAETAPEEPNPFILPPGASTTSVAKSVEATPEPMKPARAERGPGPVLGIEPSAVPKRKELPSQPAVSSDGPITQKSQLTEAEVIEFFNQRFSSCTYWEREKNTDVRLLSAVIEADLKHLAKLRNITNLNLREIPLTDAGMKEIATFDSLKNLKILWIRSGELTDAGLKELARFTQLEELWLEDNKITDAGLPELAGLKKLRMLNLSKNLVTDAGLPALKELPLRQLWLDHCKITNEGVKHLAQLTGLRELYLEATLIDDEGLKDLAPLTSLQNLILSHTHITSAGFKYLTPLEQLYFLCVIDTDITDEGLKELATTVPHLKKLYVSGKQITKQGRDELKKVMPEIGFE
jgi:hypothetical protein